MGKIGRLRRSPAWWIWLAVWGCLADAAYGLDVDFQAWVDRTRVGPSDPIQLTLSIRSNARLDHVPAPEIDLSAFDVEGPAVTTSTNVSIVNMHQSVTYVRDLVYTLYARRTGRLVIGPARLQLGGRPYQTKALVVDVLRGAAHQSVPAAGSAPVGSSSGTGASGSALFVRVQASSDQAYVGQPIIVEYDLCYRTPLDNVGLKSVPSLSGFWNKELFAAKTLQSRREVIGGLAYNVAPLRRVALYPTHAGRQVIEPLVVSCDIPARRARSGSLFDSFFDDSFFGRAARSALIRSDSLVVDVLPLPQTGKPAVFSGAVGQFTMQVAVQPTDVAVGDPVTLHVTIDGWGNMEAVSPPRIAGPAGVKVYPPETKEKSRSAGDRLGGTRVFEYILIPETGGELQLDPVQFAYFDPDSARYRLLESPIPLLHVHGQAAGARKQDTYGLRRRDIEAVGSDIRYIKPDAQQLGGGIRLYDSWAYWLLHAVIPCGFLGLVFYQRHQLRLQGDVAYARRRRAKGQAGRRLKHAVELLRARDSQGFHAEIQRAVLAFLSDRLNLPAAGLTEAQCLEVLAARGAPEQLRQEVHAVLHACELARFASAVSSPQEMEVVRDRASKIISQLERIV